MISPEKRKRTANQRVLLIGTRGGFTISRPSPFGSRIIRKGEE